MKTKEFTNPNDLVDWLAGGYLSNWLEALEENKDLIIEGEKEAVEDSDDEVEFDPKNVDVSQIVNGTIGDPTNNFVMIHPEEVKVLFNGKEIPLYGDNSIFWLSECDLSWYYSCFTYDDWNEESTNEDLGFTVENAVRFYAQGYLTGYLTAMN